MKSYSKLKLIKLGLISFFEQLKDRINNKTQIRVLRIYIYLNTLFGKTTGLSNPFFPIDEIPKK